MRIAKNILPTYFKELPAGDFTELTPTPETGWCDFSEGVNETQIINGCLYLEDSNSADWTQTKVYTTEHILPSCFKVDIVMRLDKLCDTLVLDTLADNDVSLDGHTVTDNVSDADGGNTSGLSFIVSHAVASMRCVFLIFKSIDYDQTKNIEIWKVNSGLPIATNYVEFTRCYTGRDIELGKQFKLEIEYEVYEAITNRKSYYMTIKKDNKVLVNREICAHNSPYGGKNSMLFQVKGTSIRPTETYIYSVTHPINIMPKTYAYEVVNTSTIGESTSTVLSKVNSLVVSRPHVYCVMLGTNDFINQIDLCSFKENLYQFVSTLKDYGKVG